jgi:hypothetical protein
MRPLPGDLGKALQAALRPGETVLAQLHMNTGEALAATTERAIVLKAGFIAGAGLFGKKAISYPYDGIAAIELREGPLGGDVKILRAGVPEPPPRGSPGDYSDRNRAKNYFVTYQKRSIRDAVRRIVSIIDNRRRKPFDIAGALSQLSELRANGSLTEDEFRIAKSRVLRIEDAG